MPSDKIDAKAREIAKSGLDKWENTDRITMNEAFAPIIAAALREARSLALREAAQCANKLAGRRTDCSDLLYGFVNGAAASRDAIRALIDQSTETKP